MVVTDHVLTVSDQRSWERYPTPTDARHDPHADDVDRFRTHRADIQGLRAVAVLVVVLFHAGVPFLPGGFVGVDVFFVISGFLITGLLVRAHEAGRPGILLTFYARRALRILPLATVVLISTAIAGWFWMPATRIDDLTRTITAAGGFALNLLQIHDGAQYLRLGQAATPVQHFWSLGVEEQFYLLWPWVVAGAVALRRRIQLPLWVPMAALALGSFAWGLLMTEQDAGRAYFDPTTRGWELAAGAVLATVVTQLETIPALVGRAMRWVGLGAIAYAVGAFTEGTAFPGWHAGIPVLGACLVIAGGAVSHSRVLEAEPMTMIGEYSYGWYLWHWPVLIIAPFVLGHDLTLGEGLGVAGVTLLMARITYALVEQPARHSTLRTKPVLAVLVGLALVGVSIGTARTVADLPSRESGGAAAAVPVADLTTVSKPDRKLDAALAKALEVQKVPKNLTPKLTMARFDAPRVYRDGCHLEAEPISWAKRCEQYGKASAPARKTVVLFGDSHAAQWFPALERIADQRGWRLVNLTKGACTAADVEIYFDFFKRGYSECVRWRQRALDRIDELHPALVVASSNYDGGTALNPDGTEIAPDKQNDAWIAGWHKTLARLISDSRRTVFIEDTPWQHDNVPECLAENLKDVPACTTTRDRATAGERRTLLREAAQQDGAEVVDPASWFCTDTACPVIYGNILMYQDASHVTPEYGRILAPVVRARLKM